MRLQCIKNSVAYSASCLHAGCAVFNHTYIMEATGSKFWRSGTAWIYVIYMWKSTIGVCTSAWLQQGNSACSMQLVGPVLSAALMEFDHGPSYWCSMHVCRRRQKQVGCLFIPPKDVFSARPRLQPLRLHASSITRLSPCWCCSTQGYYHKYLRLDTAAIHPSCKVLSLVTGSW